MKTFNSFINEMMNAAGSGGGFGAANAKGFTGWI